MSHRTSLLVITSLVAGPGVVQASPLGDAATNLLPGQWTELATSIIDVLGTGAHAGNSIPYAQSGAWDPVTQTFHWLGIDHNGGNLEHYVFDADTNMWTNLGDVPTWGHGYDHIAIDPVRRRLYHHPYSYCS